MKKNFYQKTYRRVKQQRLGKKNVHIGRENDLGINYDHDYAEQRGEAGGAK